MGTYAGYPSYSEETFMYGSRGSFERGACGSWPTGDPPGSNGTHSQQTGLSEHTGPGVKLLLETPPSLDKFNPKAFVSLLSGGVRTERAAASFMSSRTSGA